MRGQQLIIGLYLLAAIASARLACGQRVQEALPPPETLDQIWNQAIAQDPQLSAHRWRIHAAQARYNAAYTQRLPTADLNSQYSVRDNNKALIVQSPGFPISTFPIEQREDFAFQAGVRVPVYTGGRITHDTAAQAAQVNSRRQATEAYTLDLKIAVAEEYVAFLRAHGELMALTSQVKSLSAHTSDVQKLYEQGRVPRNDLLAAQVAQADGEYQRIKAANQVDATQAAINRRLGRPLAQPLHIAHLALEPERAEISLLTQQAIDSRPEIALLSSEIRSAEHRTGAIQAANRPQVDLHGTYTFLENRYQAPEGITGAALTVSWNLFNRTNDYRVKAQRAESQSYRRVQTDLIRQVELHVRQAWLAVNETQQRKKVTAQAIQRANENLRVVRRRYTMGTSTNTTVLEADTLRTKALRNHNHAVHDASLAILRLRRVTGSL